MKVDYGELAKQMKEEALKAKDYVKAEIIVPSIEDKKDKFKKGEEMSVPYMNLTCRNCGDLEIASLLVALDALKKQIIQKHPKAFLMAELFFRDGGTLEHNEKTGETSFDIGEI